MLTKNAPVETENLMLQERGSIAEAMSLNTQVYKWRAGYEPGHFIHS